MGRRSDYWEQEGATAGQARRRELVGTPTRPVARDIAAEELAKFRQTYPMLSSADSVSFFRGCTEAILPGSGTRLPGD